MNISNTSKTRTAGIVAGLAAVLLVFGAFLYPVAAHADASDPVTCDFSGNLPVDENDSYDEIEAYINGLIDGMYAEFIAFMDALDALSVAETIDQAAYAALESQLSDLIGQFDEIEACIAIL